MKLVAEILTGSLFYIEVEDDATVGDRKREIGKQENLPSDRLILLLDGADDEERASLDKDEAYLKDYGVEDSSHIYNFFQFQTLDIITSSASPSTLKESAPVSLHTPWIPRVDLQITKTGRANGDEPPEQDDPLCEANEPSAALL